MKCWNLTFGYDSDHQSSVFLEQRLKYLLKCVINHIWGNSSHVYLFIWHDMNISESAPLYQSLCQHWLSPCCSKGSRALTLFLICCFTADDTLLKQFMAHPTIKVLIFTCTYVCSAKPKHLKHCDNTSPSQVMSLPPGYKVKSWNGSAHPGTSFISLFLLSPWRWWAFSLGKPQRQPGLWSLMFSPCLPS